MIDFMLTVLASALGFLLSTYIFSHFKADKYEDALADNIAKRIVAREYAKRINSELRTYDGKL